APDAETGAGCNTTPSRTPTPADADHRSGPATYPNSRSRSGPPSRAPGPRRAPSPSTAAPAPADSPRSTASTTRAGLQIMFVTQPLMDRRLRDPSLKLLHDVIPVLLDQRPAVLPQRRVRQPRKPFPHQHRPLRLHAAAAGSNPASIAGSRYFF